MHTISFYSVLRSGGLFRRTSAEVLSWLSGPMRKPHRSVALYPVISSGSSALLGDLNSPDVLVLSSVEELKDFVQY